LKQLLEIQKKRINDYEKSKGHIKCCEIAPFPQSARCPVVKQPNLAAYHSEVVGGAAKK
jgi:hypothetical protein